MQTTWTVRARWLFPADATPLENGTLTIDGGRIAAVESTGRSKPDLDFGDAAILPGLVNAHAHLDLSGFETRLPSPPEFTEWLRAVLQFRRTSTSIETAAAIERAAAECRAAGTTLVGDISGTGLSESALAESPLRAVVFHEVIGLTEARADQTWRDAAAWLERAPPASNVRRGLSPHAPYTSRRELFVRAAARGVPVQIHLAETVAELECLESHSGPLPSFLEGIGAWDAEDLASSIREITQICGPGVTGAPLLFAHGNYLDESLFDQLSSGSIVYCPRTHAYFGHTPHPFRKMMSQGVNVALGTDSLASNPDLSILEEMRFLHRRHPDVAGETILHMGTLAGARALGWAAETGSLTPGKSADWVVIPLRGADDSKDPHRLWLDNSQSAEGVYVRGVKV